MKVPSWPLVIAASLVASMVIAGVRVHIESSRALPPHAGRACDEVWRETRSGEPTVSWFRACLRVAADIYEDQAQGRTEK